MQSEGTFGKRARGVWWNLRAAPNRIATTYLNRVTWRSVAPLPGEVVSVAPASIVGHVSAPLAQEIRRACGVRHGALVPGSWDQRAVRLDFDETLVFRSCRARWVDGADWAETELYRRYVGMLERGEPCRFSSLGDLESRYRELDRIFADVRDVGGLSDADADLVTINVARDGALFWGPDGRHRIAMGRILGLPRMPGRVGFVHVRAVEAFQRLRTPGTTTVPTAVARPLWRRYGAP